MATGRRAAVKTIEDMIQMLVAVRETLAAPGESSSGRGDQNGATGLERGGSCHA
jgi:hypothetical protein